MPCHIQLPPDGGSREGVAPFLARAEHEDGGVPAVLGRVPAPLLQAVLEAWRMSEDAVVTDAGPSYSAAVTCHRARRLPCGSLASTSVGSSRKTSGLPWRYSTPLLGLRAAQSTC
ncbi:unnamed protein product [Prorocentrum cordatum]|uniref:ISXO2-like transposase domain-containing protein n=1 Tax=Prorocentrum cordatum TaxID=2364126 RepID=A0ABN9U4V3_9DINO|nr:unnamed protein product [Polarella glacialis]